MFWTFNIAEKIRNQSEGAGPTSGDDVGPFQTYPNCQTSNTTIWPLVIGSQV